MNLNNYKALLTYILFVIYTLVYPPVILGEITGDFLLFPHIGAVYRSDLIDNSLFDSDDYKYGINLFATLESGNFRFLGEALISNQEQHIERFQFGWSTGDSEFWLGRFHNPIGYWNSQFHHGSYLQNSISRPSVVEFEHDNGLLPVHLTGILIDGVIERDEQGLGYAIAAGFGPEYRNKLEALDILHPGKNSQDISITLNLYYEPLLYNPTRYGLYINYTEIPATMTGFEEIHQISSGIYGNWDSQPWRLMGSLFYIHNNLKRVNMSLDEGFFSAYIQAEYNLQERWTFFGRAEWSFSDKDDTYLGLNSRYIEERILGGVRFDMFAHHALKLEISGNRMRGDDFGQFMLQWDAMF